MSAMNSQCHVKSKQQKGERYVHVDDGEFSWELSDAENEHEAESGLVHSCCKK